MIEARREITLGAKVRDAITGFAGVAIGRTVYLNGKVSVQVQPFCLQTSGAPVDAQWFDEDRLTFDGGEEAVGLRVFRNGE